MHVIGTVVLGLGLFFGTAHAEEPAAEAAKPSGTVTVKTAWLWMDGDMDSRKHMGTTPRVEVTVKDGAVGDDACAALSKSTKIGRALWQMKGKQYAFHLRSPIELGGKHVIAGTFEVAADGTQRITSCEVVAYDPSKDAELEWPADG
jgi:hypothetical protein